MGAGEASAKVAKVERIDVMMRVVRWVFIIAEMRMNLRECFRGAKKGVFCQTKVVFPFFST